MKIQFALISAALLMTACAGTPTTSPKVVTKGPLICETGAVCPELAMKWNDDQRDGQLKLIALKPMILNNLYFWSMDSLMLTQPSVRQNMPTRCLQTQSMCLSAS